MPFFGSFFLASVPFVVDPKVKKGKGKCIPAKPVCPNYLTRAECATAWRGSKNCGWDNTKDKCVAKRLLPADNSNNRVVASQGARKGVLGKFKFEGAGGEDVDEIEGDGDEDEDEDEDEVDGDEGEDEDEDEDEERKVADEPKSKKTKGKQDKDGKDGKVGKGKKTKGGKDGTLSPLQQAAGSGKSHIASPQVKAATGSIVSCSAIVIAVAAYLAYNKRAHATADVSEATVEVSEGMTFVHDDADDYILPSDTTPLLRL